MWRWGSDAERGRRNSERGTSVQATVSEPRPKSNSRTADVQAALTRAARHRLGNAPLRRDLEDLLAAAIGARAARVTRELSRVPPLQAMDHAVDKEGWHEQEVRDRNEHREERRSPPRSQSQEGAARALPAVKRADGDGAMLRLRAEARQERRFRSGGGAGGASCEE